ncbi:MAG: lipopolysaccharide heptosyltransferase II, partial [Nitrospirae bacterium]
MTTPAIRAIRKNFKDAHISLLLRPSIAPLFKYNPDVDEVIIYENSGLIDKFRFSKSLRSKHFDLAILLQNAFDAALIAYLSRIPERIGYNTDLRGLLLTKAIR